MMEAARTSETSVDIQLRTRKYIPEDFELQNNVITKKLCQFNLIIGKMYKHDSCV
jgi:hypothetical protein